MKWEKELFCCLLNFNTCKWLSDILFNFIFCIRILHLSKWHLNQWPVCFFISHIVHAIGYLFICIQNWICWSRYLTSRLKKVVKMPRAHTSEPDFYPACILNFSFMPIHTQSSSKDTMCHRHWEFPSTAWQKHIFQIKFQDNKCYLEREHLIKQKHFLNFSLAQRHTLLFMFSPITLWERNDLPKCFICTLVVGLLLSKQWTGRVAFTSEKLG